VTGSAIEERFQRVCALSDLAVDQPRQAVLDGVAVVLVRGGDDAVHALDDRCSHGEVSLSEGFAADGCIECWAHGGAFDLATGAATQLPAFEPVAVFDTRVVDGDVYLDPHSGRIAAENGND
jgi:3-phenylpropionate/trans-cinnamate dioxygenase ferredoxin subunit